ncbi:MAG: M20/M25/M40 family metallo-hydrolase [Clostridiales bacterium]|nr:M20/M25/M40 family metallo-hydrolase [Clostridiales bacterium]
MSVYKEAVEYTKQHMEEFLGCLEKVVNYESYTFGDRETKDLCGNYLKELFQSIGFEMNTLDKAEAGCHVYGRLGDNSKKILLLGHYDTVFEHGTTKERPFSCDGKKAYGPGIYDMKGGDIAFYFAVRFLLENHLLEDKEIDIFLNADEEGGSVTSRDFVIEMARKASACLVAEPGHEGEGYVTSERYGRSVYTLKAHGTAGHAGNHPEYAVNPIVELSHQISILDKITKADGSLTCTAVSVHSGAEGSTAMIPGEGYAIFDVRYDSKENQKIVEDAFNSLTPYLKGMKLELLGGMEKPMIELTDKSRRPYDIAKETMEAEGFEFLPTKLGGGSDGNFASSAGCPTLDGLGLNGDFLHNPKEYVEISTIPNRVALLAELIRRL